MADRCAKLSRKTKETDISVGLNIDGTGKSNIDTGIGFFNHMLEGFSKHIDRLVCRQYIIVLIHHAKSVRFKRSKCLKVFP